MRKVIANNALEAIIAHVKSHVNLVNVSSNVKKGFWANVSDT